ncbi:MAG TPA: tetratricopeptide repeat protein [Acidobacteriota bacterium]|nr:tetratricopeptide repeat protein [Acidobacteriota bacterium]
MTETRTAAPRRTEGRRATPWRTAAVLLAVFAIAGTGCDRLRSRQLIRKGNQYFKEQLYADALAKYQQATTLDPKEVRLDKFIAMSYMGMYNPGSSNPKDLEALQNAIESFKSYLAAKPDDEKAAKLLVTTYMNSGKVDDAIEFFKEMLQRNPKDTAAVQTIAMLYAKKGDFENSMVWQRKRADLEPKNAEVYYTMGVTAWDKSYNSVPEALPPDQRRAIIEQGLKDLEKAIELNPDYFESMFYVGLLYRELGKMETSPAKKAEWAAKADEWQKKGLDLRKVVQDRQRQKQAKENPLEGI